MITEGSEAYVIHKISGSVRSARPQIRCNTSGRATPPTCLYKTPRSATSQSQGDINSVTDMGALYSTLHVLWRGLRNNFLKSGEAVEVERKHTQILLSIPDPEVRPVDEKVDKVTEFRQKNAACVVELQKPQNRHPAFLRTLCTYTVFDDVLKNLSLKSIVQLSRSDPALMKMIQYDYILEHVVPKTSIVFSTKYIDIDDGRVNFAKHELTPVHRRVRREQRYTPLGRLVYEADFNARNPISFRPGQYYPDSLELFLDDHSDPWSWPSRHLGPSRHHIRELVGKDRFPAPTERIGEVFYKFKDFRCCAVEGIPGPLRTDVFYRRDLNSYTVKLHAASVPYKFFLDLLVESPRQKKLKYV
jgi:hypothetical protein